MPPGGMWTQDCSINSYQSSWLALLPPQISDLPALTTTRVNSLKSHSLSLPLLCSLSMYMCVCVRIAYINISPHIWLPQISCGFFFSRALSNTDTDVLAHRENTMWRLGLCCHKPRRHQKAGQRPGTNSTLDPSETAQPSWHLDFGLLASRSVRQYISVVVSHAISGALLWGRTLLKW